MAEKVKGVVKWFNETKGLHAKVSHYKAIQRSHGIQINICHD